MTLINSRIKLVIVFENGRLGNQFFQYLFLRSAAPHAKIIFIGFYSLIDCLRHDSLPLIRSKLLHKFFQKLGKPRSVFLAKNMRLIGFISERREGVKADFSYKSGICSKVALLDGFFQDERIFSSPTVSIPSIDPDLVQDSLRWLDVNVLSKGLNPYFLHIRRGDYLQWPRGYPAVLPSHWYKSHIERISKIDSKAHFILCTDDIPYAEENFQYDLMVSLHRGSEVQDFVLMTQCSGGGILSASTFSWWAALYGKQSFPSAYYVAPKYWAGWGKNAWYPPSMVSSWLDYSEVKNL